MNALISVNQGTINTCIEVVCKLFLRLEMKYFYNGKLFTDGISRWLQLQHGEGEDGLTDPTSLSTVFPTKSNAEMNPLYTNQCEPTLQVTINTCLKEVCGKTLPPPGDIQTSSLTNFSKERDARYKTRTVHVFPSPATITHFRYGGLLLSSKQQTEKQTSGLRANEEIN